MSMSRPILSQAGPDDMSFVHHAWTKSFQQAEGVRALEPQLFYTWHRKVRNAILERSTVLVLRDPDQNDYLYGFIVVESLDPSTLVVHFAYVRSGERGNQYGYQLLHAALALNPEAERLVYTHRTYFAPKAESLGFVFARLREVQYEIE